MLGGGPLLLGPRGGVGLLERVVVLELLAQRGQARAEVGAGGLRRRVVVGAGGDVAPRGLAGVDPALQALLVGAELAAAGLRLQVLDAAGRLGAELVALGAEVGGEPAQGRGGLVGLAARVLEGGSWRAGRARTADRSRE